MKKAIFVLIFILSISLAYAQPALPIQIYGDVDKDIEDGTTISFQIDGIEFGYGTIENNEFGYDPLIFIMQDDVFTEEKEGYLEGDIVEVYVGDVKVEETSFGGDMILELHLTIPEGTTIESPTNTTKTTITSPTASTETESTVGSRSLGGSDICNPTWECSDWGECINGQQTRACVDKWSCGTTSGKPSTVQTCTVEAEPVLQQPVQREPVVQKPEVIPEGASSFGWVYIILAIIVLSILGGAGFVFYEKKRAHSALHQEKQQPSLEKQSMDRLKSYVTQTLEQGYTKQQIRQTLLNEGWSQNIINKVIK